LDVRPGVVGIDAGPHPTPFDRAEQLAADAYGAARTWFLTGGASQGNQVACLTMTHAGLPVLVQRDCHLSILNGLVLSGARPIYVEPELDQPSGLPTGLSPSRLCAELAAAPGTTAVLLTAPSYFGAVGRLRECIAAAHAEDVPVLVDQSWGALFGFHPRLPRSALELGADVVITSTHKSVGSLTQSAMLHVSHGSRVGASAIDRALTLVRSTSESSLLRASLDAARRRAADEGSRLVARTLRRADWTRARLRDVSGCAVLDPGGSPSGPPAWDPLRIVIDVSLAGISGLRVAEGLRDEDDLHVALATERHLVLALGLDEPCAPLVKLTERLAARLSAATRPPTMPSTSIFPTPGRASLSPREAYLGAIETVHVASAVGRVAASPICCYPPGTPLIAPGEVITDGTASAVIALRRAGHRIAGLRGERSIDVVAAERPVAPTSGR
jgi:lysine decarboxylase